MFTSTHSRKILGLHLCRNKKRHQNDWPKYVGTKRHLQSFIPTIPINRKQSPCFSTQESISFYITHNLPTTHMGHFVNNAQGGKTAEWMMQSQWKLCHSQLKTWGAARVFITSLGCAVLNRRVLDLRLQEPRVLWRLTIKDRTSRLKLYVANPLQKFALPCVKFVVSRQ
jgi:hypothetical protein